MLNTRSFLKSLLLIGVAPTVLTRVMKDRFHWHGNLLVPNETIIIGPGIPFSVMVSDLNGRPEWLTGVKKMDWWAADQEANRKARLASPNPDWVDAPYKVTVHNFTGLQSPEIPERYFNGT